MSEVARDNVVEIRKEWERQPYKMETGIPVELPNACKKYPEIKSMNVGDSFYVAGEKTSTQLARAAQRYAKRAGWTVVARKEKTGRRIYRTA